VSEDPVDGAPHHHPILVVDPDESRARAFTDAFAETFSIVACTDPDEAMRRLGEEDFAVLVAADDLGGVSGVDFLARSIEVEPDVRRFLIADAADPKVVIDALHRARIDHYVPRPWDEIALRIALQRAIEQRAALLQTRAQMARLRAQNAALGHQVREGNRAAGEAADRERRLTASDGITGLHNHRHFLERWRGEVRRCRRYGQTVSLIHLEVDGLPRGSSTAPGPSDDLLREIAILLRSSVRDVDLVARFSASEFAIVLPETPKGNGALLAGRLGGAIRDRDLARPDGQRVTVSVGVGAFPEDGTTSSSVLAATRSAMKRSRVRGGDQLFIVDSNDETSLAAQVESMPGRDGISFMALSGEFEPVDG